MYLSFCRSMIISRSSHIAANGVASFFIINIPQTYTHTHLLHPFLSGHLGCVYVLAAVNRAAVDTGVRVSF